MISNPEYISWLRHTQSLSNTVTMIQLSSIGVGSFHMEDLAKRLGMKRPNLNNNLLSLREAKLIGYCGVNARGTYLYWVKQDFSDKPVDPPGWTIRDKENDWDYFVEIGDLKDFAKTIKCSATGLRRLVKGDQSLLLNRYECISKPKLPSSIS